MAYKNGKPYLTKREQEIRKYLKEKNIEGILWVILNDCFDDMEDSSKSPRHNKTLFSFVIQQLAIMENKKNGKMKNVPDSADGKKLIEKWLTIKEDEEND